MSVAFFCSARAGNQILPTAFGGWFKSSLQQALLSFPSNPNQRQLVDGSSPHYNKRYFFISLKSYQRQLVDGSSPHCCVCPNRGRDDRDSMNSEDLNNLPTAVGGSSDQAGAAAGICGRYREVEPSFADNGSGSVRFTPRVESINNGGGGFATSISSAASITSSIRDTKII